FRRRRPSPVPSLFPYTTLFRSWLSSGPGVLVMAASLSAGPRAGRLPRTSRGRPLRRTKGAAAAVLGWGSGVLLDLRPLALDVLEERKSTRRTSSHVAISDAVFS